MITDIASKASNCKHPLKWRPARQFEEVGPPILLLQLEGQAPTGVHLSVAGLAGHRDQRK